MGGGGFIVITCPCCGSSLTDDGELASEDSEEWCNTCGDLRPILDGVCARCGRDPSLEDDEEVCGSCGEVMSEGVCVDGVYYCMDCAEISS